MLWVLPVLAAVLSAAGWYGYNVCRNTVNHLVALDRRCETAFADMDFHQKHRRNIIPGLAAMADDLAEPQRDLITRIRDTNAKALNATTTAMRLRAEGHLTAQIAELLVADDRSAGLGAIPEIAELRRQLVECENRITAARRFYNLAIEEYNAAMRQFPGCYLAERMRMITRHPCGAAAGRVSAL
ncbi:MAG: LemA family protein [Alphaproteobacteria bacterium]|nr:LemA family protein [Alphaproteobacteria bacterium]